MAEGLTGSLAQLPLSDILTMLGAGGQSGRLELSSSGGQGEVYLRKGAIVHAISGAKTGEIALVQLLSWPGGAFRFQPQVLSPDTTIDKPLAQLLSESARHAAERQAVYALIPSPAAVPQLSPDAPPQPITLQPRDWQIITRVNGRDSVADIAANMRVDEFAVLQTLAPLVAAGLIQIEVAATQAPPVRHTVGFQFFHTLTGAVAAAMGPLAEIIIDDCIADMGATRDEFPREMVSALVERVAGEIRDAEKRVTFQQTMLGILRNGALAA